MKLRNAVLGLLLFATTLAGCNVYRAMNPSTHTDSTPPRLPDALPAPAILVYTKTNGFRHGEAIRAGVAWLEALAERRGWSVFHTENGAVFNDEDLARFQVAFWHNASGDSLDDAQKLAFRSWLEAGGGYVGTHAAGDASHSWPFYVQQIIGADFIGHPMGPQFQDAAVAVEDRSHPASRELPESFTHNDEWYSFAESPRGVEGVHVLATIDESSYIPRQKLLWMEQDLAMGDHPVVWWRCVGRGRALYSAIGHQASSYETPEVAALLEGALRWAAGLEGEGCR